MSCAAAACFRVKRIMKLPLKRNFVPLTASVGSHKVLYSCRVLQFNLLADGLSGLREDLGAFSRIKKEDIVWENRKHLLLNEILQYDPDIITVQECDHFEHYFEPLLREQGYVGVFAEKPDSPCLEVSDHGDGCAVFVRSSKLNIVGTTILRYSISPKDKAVALAQITGAETSSSSELDDTPKTQNQLAVLVKCEFTGSAGSAETPAASASGSVLPTLLIATTHLKATKSAEGEAVRYLEMRQLLSEVESQTTANEKPCAVLVTGDFNACPASQQTDFRSLTLEYVRAWKNCNSNSISSISSSGTDSDGCSLRSVYNDDLVEQLLNEKAGASRDTVESSDIWTTWKGRVKENQSDGTTSERIVKQCIDYILYQPPALAATSAATTSSISGGSSSDVGIVARGVLSLYDDDRMRDTDYLPSSVYPSDHIAIAADLDIVGM